MNGTFICAQINVLKHHTGNTNNKLENTTKCKYYVVSNQIQTQIVPIKGKGLGWWGTAYLCYGEEVGQLR